MAGDVAEYRRLYQEYKNAEKAYDDAIRKVMAGNEDPRRMLVALGAACISTHKAWMREGANFSAGEPAPND